MNITLRPEFSTLIFADGDTVVECLGSNVTRDSGLTAGQAIPCSAAPSRIFVARLRTRLTYRSARSGLMP